MWNCRGSGGDKHGITRFFVNRRNILHLHRWPQSWRPLVTRSSTTLMARNSLSFGSCPAVSSLDFAFSTAATTVGRTTNPGRCTYLEGIAAVEFGFDDTKPGFNIRCSKRFIHTTDIRSSSHETNAKKNEFAQSWLRIKDRLLRKEIGAFESLHWMEADQLLTTLRNHTAFASTSNKTNNTTSSTIVITPHQRVIFLFQILDRLCAEAQTTTLLHNNPRRQHNKSATSLPWNVAILTPILVCWRDFILSRSSALIPPTAGSESESLDLSPKAVQKRVDQYMAMGLFYPDSIPYNIILHVLGQVNENNASAVLHMEEKEKQQAVWQGEEIFQSMLHKSQHPPTKNKQSRRRRQQQQQQQYHWKYHPTAKTLYSMVELWAKSGVPQLAAQKAEDYLTLFHQWYSLAQQPTQQGHSPMYGSLDEYLRTLPYIYCAVMEAHGRSSHPDVALARIQELFAHMKKYCHLPQHQRYSLLDSRVYARVCHAVVMSRRPKSPDIARDILEELWELHQGELKKQQWQYNNDKQQRPQHSQSSQPRMTAQQQRQYQFQPSLHIYTDVLTAYGRSGRVQEAQALFDSLQQQEAFLGSSNAAVSDHSLDLPSRIVLYSALIWAYAYAKDTTGAERVFSEMVRNMEENYDPGEWESLDPSSVWNGVLVSWAQSGDPQAAERISLLLDRLNKSYAQQRGNDPLRTKKKPWINTTSYNILLTCYATQQPIERAIEGAQEADKLVQWMKSQEDPRFQPDKETYRNLLLAWKNAGDPERCQDALDQFLQAVDHGVVKNHSFLDQKHFSIVIEAWANSKHPQAAEKASAILDNYMKPLGIKPNKVCYTSLMWVWARCSTNFTGPDHQPMSPLPIEQIYQQMIRQWKNEQDPYAAPNEWTLNALCYGLSQSHDPEALDRVHQYCTELRELGGAVKLPSVRLYNTLMAAWSKRHRPDQVDKLFQELQSSFERTGDTDFKPHAKAYNTRLHAWARVGNAERATETLQEWISEAESVGLHPFPATYEFNTVLQAWVLSKRPDAAVKAERGLRQMIRYAESGRFACFPNVISYTTVISAYASSVIPSSHIVASHREAAAVRKVDDPVNSATLRSIGTNALRLLNELQQLSKQVQQTQISPKENDANDLEPNFITYTSVILALLRSVACVASEPSSNGQNNEQIFFDAIASVQALLKEMQTKERHFWTQGKVRCSKHLAKIRQAILDKQRFIPAHVTQELMSECNRLEFQVALLNSNG